LFPVVVEPLQIVNPERDERVNQRLPGDVPDKRLVGKAVDERQHVGDQDRLAEYE
jgi:hypothetical protein